ncbi:MAG: aminopeptidase [Candidatus Aenigmatarchaeota archaeon]
MKRAIEKILTNCFNIRPNTKILIVTDSKMLKIAKNFYDIAKEISFHSYLISMKPRKRDGEEPPKKIADLIKNSDIVLAITSKSLTHTKAAIEACRKGVHIASMPNLSKFSITKGGLLADYKIVSKLCKKMLKKVSNSKNIKIISENGTNIEFSVEGREWKVDEGLFLEKPKLGNLPAGEVFVAPLENSVNGTIVFDFFELAKGKIKLEIGRGKVIKLMGKAPKLLKIFQTLGSKARQIAEFGIGCNPKAKIIGNSLEDEKVFGTVHLALGNNIGFGGKNKVDFHKDGIIKKPTVIVDGKILIEDGKWKI